MKFLIISLLLASILLAKVDISLSHTNIKHGTTFAVILQSDTKLTHAPNVIFKNKTYQMFTIAGNTKKYEVFLPVDYHAKKQKENVQVKYKQNDKVIKKNMTINIIDGKYKQNEIIKVAKGKVKLSKKNKTRSSTEYNEVYKKVYSVITQKNLAKKSTFQLPMKSKITSNFGNARIYNGIAKSYHSGTDFRAKVGTPIYSANDGKVALVMHRFYLGKVVYIDHGRGAYTYYCHMDNIDVKTGQTIKKGQKLGLSGKTGRITGPHLHYAVRLYNTTVDPLQYGELYNQILSKYH
jgi:murein DD-endopeptidase MepM/ murein hydrolase activator NlpD